MHIRGRGTDLYTHATQRTAMLDALSSGDVDVARASMKRVCVTLISFARHCYHWKNPAFALDQILQAHG